MMANTDTGQQSTTMEKSLGVTSASLANLPFIDAKSFDSAASEIGSSEKMASVDESVTPTSSPSPDVEEQASQASPEPEPRRITTPLKSALKRGSTKRRLQVVINESRNTYCEVASSEDDIRCAAPPLLVRAFTLPEPLTSRRASPLDNVGDHMVHDGAPLQETPVDDSESESSSLDGLEVLSHPAPLAKLDEDDLSLEVPTLQSVSASSESTDETAASSGRRSPDTSAELKSEESRSTEEHVSVSCSEDDSFWKRSDEDSEKAEDELCHGESVDVEPSQVCDYTDIPPRLPVPEVPSAQDAVASDCSETGTPSPEGTPSRTVGSWRNLPDLVSDGACSAAVVERASPPDGSVLTIANVQQHDKVMELSDSRGGILKGGRLWAGGHGAGSDDSDDSQTRRRRGSGRSVRFERREPPEPAPRLMPPPIPPPPPPLPPPADDDEDDGASNMSSLDTVIAADDPRLSSHLVAQTELPSAQGTLSKLALVTSLGRSDTDVARAIEHNSLRRSLVHANDRRPTSHVPGESPAASDDSSTVTSSRFGDLADLGSGGSLLSSRRQSSFRDHDLFSSLDIEVPRDVREWKMSYTLWPTPSPSPPPRSSSSATVPASAPSSATAPVSAPSLVTAPSSVPQSVSAPPPTTTAVSAPLSDIASVPAPPPVTAARASANPPAADTPSSAPRSATASASAPPTAPAPVLEERWQAEVRQRDLEQAGTTRTLPEQPDHRLGSTASGKRSASDVRSDQNEKAAASPSHQPRRSMRGWMPNGRIHQAAQQLFNQTAQQSGQQRHQEQSTQSPEPSQRQRFYQQDTRQSNQQQQQQQQRQQQQQHQAGQTRVSWHGSAVSRPAEHEGWRGAPPGERLSAASSDEGWRGTSSGGQPVAGVRLSASSEEGWRRTPTGGHEEWRGAPVTGHPTASPRLSTASSDEGWRGTPTGGHEGWRGTPGSGHPTASPRLSTASSEEVWRGAPTGSQPAAGARLSTASSADSTDSRCGPSHQPHDPRDVYSLDDIDDALEDPAPAEVTGPARAAGSADSGYTSNDGRVAGAEPDELAAFAEQESERTERLRRRYVSPGEQSLRRPPARGTQSYRQDHSTAHSMRDLRSMHPPAGPGAPWAPQGARPAPPPQSWGTLPANYTYPEHQPPNYTHPEHQPPLPPRQRDMRPPVPAGAHPQYGDWPAGAHGTWPADGHGTWPAATSGVLPPVHHHQPTAHQRADWQDSRLPRSNQYPPYMPEIPRRPPARDAWQSHWAPQN